MVSLKWCCKQKDGIKIIEPNDNLAQGYLKKAGDSAKVVDRAQARAETKPGTVGVKVAILSPHAVLKDKIVITDALLKKLKGNEKEEEPVKKTKKKSSRKSKTKEGK